MNNDPNNSSLKNFRCIIIHTHNIIWQSSFITCVIIWQSSHRQTPKCFNFNEAINPFCGYGQSSLTRFPTSILPIHVPFETMGLGNGWFLLFILSVSSSSAAIISVYMQNTIYLEFLCGKLRRNLFIVETYNHPRKLHLVNCKDAKLNWLHNIDN